MRTVEQREADRKRIAYLRVIGHSPAQIAKEMNLTHRIVHGELTAIKNIQARQLSKDLKQMLGMQLSRMELLLSNALQGFEMSKTAAKVTQTRLPDGSVAERLEYHPGGDPKYLSSAKGIVESMNRMLGLDNTPVLQQTNVTVDASHLLSQPMSVEDYMKATQAQQLPSAEPVVETATLGTPDVDVQRLMDSLDQADATSAEEDENGW